MRTEKEKRMIAFLKKEGWGEITEKAWLDIYPDFDWTDGQVNCTLLEAFRLANRRKSAREARKLKAAGYRATRSKHMPGWWWINEDKVLRSRGRAIGRLEIEQARPTTKETR